MFRITQDPSSGSDSLYLTGITYDGSFVLIVCVIGVWRHILDCNRQGELKGASSMRLKIQAVPRCERTKTWFQVSTVHHYY